jgi:hypothetical protein
LPVLPYFVLHTFDPALASSPAHIFFFIRLL